MPNSLPVGGMFVCVGKPRIYSTSFASVYPHYVAKAEKKNRTKAEVDEIEEATMREIRYLDKLIDELAKGKPMEKILRSAASV